MKRKIYLHECQESDEGESCNIIPKSLVQGMKIYLYDEIELRTSSEISVSCDSVSHLKLDSHITIEINSSGGSLESAIAIISTLKIDCHKIESDVRGIAYSAAAWIAISCDKRKMSKMGSLMFHSPRFSPAEEALEEREDLTNFSKKQYIYIVKSILQNTRISTEDFLQRTNNREWYVDSTEALSLGLVDETY